MVIFHSYVSLPEGIIGIVTVFLMKRILSWQKPKGPRSKKANQDPPEQPGKWGWSRKYRKEGLPSSDLT